MTLPYKNLLVIMMVIVIIGGSCTDNKTLFRKISPGKSGIDFTNTITETDSLNQLDNGNVYNGGGVGIGDFNNDGRPDLFFTGNTSSCRLYLNKGNFRFTDITDKAGTDGEGKWCRGVALTDINNDGFLDIYISATLLKDPEKRRNILYINQGPGNDGIPRFRDMAAEYGLDNDSHTTQAAFFDYDNDGDLDVYLTVNEINDRNSPYVFHEPSSGGIVSNGGRLLRNDWNDSLHHPVFTDVTAISGIGREGFGNQASITDINNDGWKDIYVSNDYLSNDLLWINNKNGTFTEKLSSCFRHTSNSAMGNDIADINNDGLMDVITLDMNPEDNYRKKMMLPPASYQFYQNSERYGYNYQYTRNTLQLNQGNPGISADSLPVFSEIGYYAGIEATDWSWTSLIADLDNDGLKDLFIANGFPKDITDRDFGMYRANGWMSTPKMELLKQVPEVKIHNYAYRNNGNLTFTNESSAWGFSEKTFSNGAAYGDIDGDGDLDLVVNNINDKASVYRNMTVEKNQGKNHFIRIKFTGDRNNKNGLGATARIWYSGHTQVWENEPSRGYISSSENIAHFGLGENTHLDSLVALWPGFVSQTIINPAIDKTTDVRFSDAVPARQVAGLKPSALFTDITSATGISFIHRQEDFTDFSIQKLIPHKLSEYGPRLATGDLNNDGLDDIVAGGSAGYCTTIFIQQKDERFVKSYLGGKEKDETKKYDDGGLLLIDVDGDGDSDLIIVAGGYIDEGGSNSYNDHLYLNDGKGNFSELKGALPQALISKSCIKATDIDHDGDYDLFIGGRVKPWSYPQPVSGFIYRNDSEKGKIKFTDITATAAPGLKDIGIISDAVFTDIDNDGWQDLVVAGEWMPVSLFKNDKGNFKNITPGSGIENLSGWWSSLAAEDFDNDGDTDIVAGNLGLNSFYKTFPVHPVTIYGSDFDHNGSYDAFTSLWLMSSQDDTTMRSFPAQGRDDLIKQMLSIRARFKTFKAFATTEAVNLFTPAQLKEALVLEAREFRSMLFRNDGNGKFTPLPLPGKAQFSVLHGMATGDFNGDGNKDILINGNDYGTDVLIGRYDAISGLLLAGNGRGAFTEQGSATSGFFIPGDGRDLVKLKGPGGIILYAASQNKGPLKIFMLKK
ncbi:MAG: VCBS repeat-containing protein [Bacteroidales bacterium]